MNGRGSSIDLTTIISSVCSDDGGEISIVVGASSDIGKRFQWDEPTLG
jgi:hypothetical protein